MEMSLVSFDERLGFATMTGKAYVGGRVSELLIILFRMSPLKPTCVSSL